PQDPGTPPPTTAASTQGGSGTASGGGGSSGGGSGFESGGGFSPPSQSSGSAPGGTAPAEGAGVASGGPVAPGPGPASTWSAAVPAQRQSVVWSRLVNVTCHGRGDVFRIAVVAGTVRYYKNGRLLYISGLAPAYPLTVGTALISRGATVTNVIISGRFSKGTAMPLDSAGSAVSWSDNRLDGFEGVQREIG